ncbi:unnamed protein product [Prunus armeniaca]
MKLPLEPEFEDQAPRMLRNDRDALGNTLLGMKGLWHGSKINMSLAPNRKIWITREKGECLSLTETLSSVRTACQERKLRENDGLSTKMLGFGSKRGSLLSEMWFPLVG